jgi:hypothetical protein
MAQLLKTEITGSLTDTGSLVISGSQPVQLPVLTSGSGDVDPELMTNQFWFDQGDNNIKYSVIGSYGSSAWTQGGSMINNRSQGAGSGTSTAALAAGGYKPSSACVACTEEYNGTTWSESGAMTFLRLNMAPAGTQNASLASGGIIAPSPNGIVSCTEEYNGATWAASTALNNGRRDLAGGGSQNAAIAAGGATPTVVTCAEEYNGSSWSTAGGLITARTNFYSQNIGTQNSGLFVGGATPTIVACVEGYDGNAFSSLTALPAAVRAQGGGGGCTNAAWIAGGNNPTKVKTSFEFDGTTWTSGPDMTELKDHAQSSGTAFDGFMAGGEQGPAIVATTYEWNRNYIVPFTTNTNSTWAAGGDLIRPRGLSGGAGTINAGIAFGGYNSSGPYSNCTEEYNGTAWAEGGALAISRYDLKGAGTQNAALAFGGKPGAKTDTEEYNGTAWSPGGAMIVGKSELGGAGSQNAALAFGGYCSGAPYANNCTEEYNGTAWSTGNAMGTSMRAQGSAGSQNAALSFGGQVSPNKVTLEYDGTNWTTGGSLSIAKYKLGGSGAQDTALAFGGGPGYQTSTEEYNGSTWSVKSNMINGRQQLGSNPSATDGALAIGGYGNAPNCEKTEEYVQNFICTNTYKCSLPSTNAWSAGGTMITAAAGYGARAGIQNAYAQTVSVGDTDSHEHYNGTSWSNQTCYPNAGRSAGSAGADSEDFIVFGGLTHTCSNKWNGSSWSATNAMNVARYYLGGVGTANSAAAVGGLIPPNNYTTCHETWDGTNWSNATAVPTSGQVSGQGVGGTNANDHGVAGTNIGGCAVSVWNGSSWSSPSNINFAHAWGGGNATSTNAWLIFGGEGVPSPYAGCKLTEEYDGTSWSTRAQLTIGGAVGYAGGSGASPTAGIMPGRYNYPTGNMSNTEEYATTPGASVYYNRCTCVRCITGDCTQIN